MNRSHILVALVTAAMVGPVGAADSDTALEMRLESIESRLPEAGRIAALEKKVQRLAQARNVAAESNGDSGGSARGGDAVFSLYQDVQALTEDVRNLRGQIQELKHEAEQREQRQRDLYESLDERLKVLEREAGVASDSDVGADDAGDGGDSSSSESDGAAAEKAYMAAFDQLKAGKYDQARTSFQDFVQAHPDSEYTDNAWYWLGEARYVDRQYDPALTAFQNVIEDFPDSQKVPGAIYKSGVILDEQGKYDKARKALNRVIDQYPDDNAADLARKRLDGMDGG